MRINLAEIEKMVYKFIIKNRYRFALVVFVYFLVQFFTGLPYLNLIFTEELTLLIILSLSIFIFKPSVKIIVVISLLLLFFALIAEIIDRKELAESMGNYVYVILLTGVIRAIAGLHEK